MHISHRSVLNWESMVHLDTKQVAIELIRALRGKRSQAMFCRRLGYKSNVATDWEHGRRFPTGVQFLRACGLHGVDVPRVLEHFQSTSMKPLSEVAKRQDQTTSNPIETSALCDWLGMLRGSQSIESVADRCGKSRFAVGRWLRGDADPRLPDFLGLIEALTSRLSDFVALLVDIEKIESLRNQRAQRLAMRELAFREPWTEAVFLLLQSETYRRTTPSPIGFVARYLGVDEVLAERTLSLLEEAGLIRWTDNHFETQGELTVDTRAEPAKVSALKAHWVRVAERRALEPQPTDLIAYNIFSCSPKDFETIRTRLRALFFELRALIAGSQPAETLGLLQFNLIELRTKRP